MVLFRDVLCTDKTGTLTMDRVVMVHHLDSWGMSSDKILYFTFLNSYFQTGFKNPLDDAILAYVYTGGYKFEPTKWIRINELPFDFSRRRMSVILEEINHNHVHRNKHPLLVERIMVTKGAYEEVLKLNKQEGSRHSFLYSFIPVCAPPTIIEQKKPIFVFPFNHWSHIL
jgi:Mg2+-importing ATPase